MFTLCFEREVTLLLSQNTGAIINVGGLGLRCSNQRHTPETRWIKWWAHRTNHQNDKGRPRPPQEVNDLGKTHRIGPVYKGRKDVIVRITTHSARYTIYGKRKTCKNKWVRITPSLTDKRRKMLLEVNRANHAEYIEWLLFPLPPSPLTTRISVVYATKLWW